MSCQLHLEAQYRTSSSAGTAHLVARNACFCVLSQKLLLLVHSLRRNSLSRPTATSHPFDSSNPAYEVVQMKPASWNDLFHAYLSKGSGFQPTAATSLRCIYAVSHITHSPTATNLINSRPQQAYGVSTITNDQARTESDWLQGDLYPSPFHAGSPGDQLLASTSTI